eukprot:TRINITY_DN26073_c0_g1_i1.p1 TRINITY_DN26073_c0_g1~~TRINITY_DN26073_c0_g1_i1.p1  ORF type:complete len:688 (-),score=106.76 TRINITY_DN26073_c0_g1_i1:61-2124(-)
MIAVMPLAASGSLLLACLAFAAAGNHLSDRYFNGNQNIATSLLTLDHDDAKSSSCAAGLVQMHAASLSTKKKSSSSPPHPAVNSQQNGLPENLSVSHLQALSAINSWEYSFGNPPAGAAAPAAPYQHVSEKQRDAMTSWWTSWWASGIPMLSWSLKTMKPEDMENMYATYMSREQARRNVITLLWGFSHPPSTEWDRQKIYFWWTLAICLPGTLLLQALWSKCFKLDRGAEAPPEASPSVLVPNPAVEGAVAPSKERVFWPHLSGIRFLLAVWVFCAHCGGMPVFSVVACNGTIEDCAGQAWFSSASLVALVTRGYVAVNAFMILAGFMTEVGFWKVDDFLRPVDAFRFLKSRLITILPGYWVALTWLIYLQERELVATAFNSMEPNRVWSYLKCFFLVETWPFFEFRQLPLDEPASMTMPVYGPLPNTLENVIFWRTIHLWFVSSLFFSMILAPAVHNFLHLLRRSQNRHVWLASAMFLSGFLMNLPSMLAYHAYGVDIKFPLLNKIECSAITTCGQFIFGMCTGALLQDRASAWETSASKGSTFLSEVFLTLGGDTCFIALILGTMWIPTYSYSVMGGEVFWLTGMGTLMALVFYCTCHPGCGKGLVHNLCGNFVLAKLGEYSFYIFLLHVQVCEVLSGMVYGFPVPMIPRTNTRFLVFTFIILLGLSILAAEATKKLLAGPRKK